MSQQSAARAGRAIGAMFFAVFGAAWIALWSLEAYGVSPSILIADTVVSLVLLVLSFRQFRQNRDAHAAAEGSAQSKRASRAFNIVNAVQWTLIFLVANALSMLGLKEWIIPAIIFIVGAHFVPLALAFKLPRHHVTGAALMLLAILYPLSAVNGPANPIGCLGAGIILWISAVAALTLDPNPVPEGA